MITSLSIENFALIEKLNVNFSKEFTVITGETGAGKSILLGALGLLLGKRADLSSLKNSQEKCIIEGSFLISEYNLQSFFEENELDYETETIIRREILPSGKSRAFINDTPVNLQQLQDLSSYLIDIHSQNQNQELSSTDFQTELLDTFADNKLTINEYQSLLKKYKNLKRNFDELSNSKLNLQKESDYNAFLLNEITSLNLKSDEQEELENELEKLSNVDSIKESFDYFLSLSNQEEIGVVSQLKTLKSILQKISPISSEYQLLFSRIESLLIDFQDISQEVFLENDKLFGDPERLSYVNSRLQSIYSLQKKHMVSDVESLLKIEEELSKKVFLANDIDNQLQQLEKDINLSELELNNLAKIIHENRAKIAPELTKSLLNILADLGMPNAQFKFDINHTQVFYENGKDEIQLLFSANKGSNFGQLKKVASGGEMSRIMLAVKSVLAKKNNLPTIIFDEIDTGISGEIAKKMSEIMSEMSKKMQVFAITHLAQIAAKGKHHYKVSKKTVENHTVSEVKLLNKDERIHEVAEMISGKNITESALNHAKELIN
jgi:DNA repair protein RecN (Recombination protein N)